MNIILKVTDEKDFNEFYERIHGIEKIMDSHTDFHIVHSMNNEILISVSNKLFKIIEDIVYKAISEHKDEMLKTIKDTANANINNTRIGNMSIKNKTGIRVMVITNKAMLVGSKPLRMGKKRVSMERVVMRFNMYITDEIKNEYYGYGEEIMYCHNFTVEACTVLANMIKKFSIIDILYLKDSCNKFNLNL